MLIIIIKMAHQPQNVNNITKKTSIFADWLSKTVVTKKSINLKWQTACTSARAVNIADYQAFTEKSFADAGKPWQSSAIGDGKLCLTAGKPQSGAACGKKATINMCLEVAQHCSTSSTPIYCVGFDSPQVSLRYTSG